MEKIVANIKYLRISPRKLRDAVFVISKLNLKNVLSQLEFMPGSSAKPLLKALKSVVANAKDKLKVEVDNLKISKIEVSEGPRFKRYNPVARGSAHQYKKRTAHLLIELVKI